MLISILIILKILFPRVWFFTREAKCQNCLLLPSSVCAHSRCLTPTLGFARGLSCSSFLAAASMDAAAPSSSVSAITVGSSGSTHSDPGEGHQRSFSTKRRSDCCHPKIMPQTHRRWGRRHGRRQQNHCDYTQNTPAHTHTHSIPCIADGGRWVTITATEMEWLTSDEVAQRKINK